MQAKRPRISLTWTLWDMVLETAGWLALTLFWINLFASYNQVPVKIPTHFDLAGNPDAFGHKSQLFVLPSVASVLFMGLTWLNKFPHIFNYPIEINEQNAETQYRLATRFLRWIKGWIVLLFMIISLQSMNSSNHSTVSLNWLLPAMLSGIFFGLITYLIVAAKKS
jgi:uncharacterized membrane protein